MLAINQNEFDKNINSIYKDHIININHLESINEDVNNSQDSSIIVDSCYILDSSDSFLIEESKKGINEEKRKVLPYIKKDDAKILEFKKIIGKHKNSADFIRDFNNNYFISGGIDNKLVLYSSDYQKIKEKKLGYLLFNMNKAKTGDNNTLDIIVTSNVNLYLIRIDENKYIFNNYRETKSYKFCFEVSNYHYIIGDKSGCYMFYNIFSKIIQYQKDIQISNKFYNSGIQINKYVIALTSNRILPNGEDKLILFNCLLKQKTYEIEGFSYISSSSSNGLSIINKGEDKILLCAYKKYLKCQQNGILLINVKMGEKETIKYYFYDTGNFEVNCFCQIFVLDETNNKILDDNKITIETNYFLVGGFERKKGKGLIKLYKIINNKNFLETKIEFIQDITIEKNEIFKGFKGAITNIIQTKNNGNLLMTSWDENVYLFSKPNMDYLLFYDKN